MIAVLCLCSNNPTLVRSMVILSGMGHLGEPVVVNVFLFRLSHIYFYGIVLIFLVEIISFYHIPIFLF